MHATDNSAMIFEKRNTGANKFECLYTL